MNSEEFFYIVALAMVQTFKADVEEIEVALIELSLQPSEGNKNEPVCILI